MFLIIKIFFMLCFLIFALAFLSGITLFMRIRQYLQNPFLRAQKNTPSPPPGNGDVIEGEYKVLDD